MFPSGLWRGFWEQEWFGRQPMESFYLFFRDGAVSGYGHDVVGPFTFSGDYDEQTGQVRMVKKYLGKHQVLYEGRPDGEGSISGRWSLNESGAGVKYVTSGPFVLHPVLPKPTGEEPIHEIKK